MDVNAALGSHDWLGFNSSQNRAPVVAIYDSGIGGVTLAKKMVIAHPSANFVYFMDNAWFPYGEKSYDRLTTRVSHVLNYLAWGTVPDVTVIACNTATTSLPPIIASMFGNRLFGVSPFRASTDDEAVVLCTPATRRNLEHVSKLARPEIVGLPGLAEIAERKFTDPGNHIDEVARVFHRLPDLKCIERARTVVLGCTHYALLLDELKELFPRVVSWVDPVDQVVDSVLARTARPNSSFCSDGYRIVRCTALLSESLSRALSRNGFHEFRHLGI